MALISLQRGAGLNFLISRFQRAPNILPRMIGEAVDLVAEAGVQALHDASPVDNAPNNGVIPGEFGHLNESFYAKAAVPRKTGASASVLTTEPIKFQYVTQGTDTPIVPVSKAALWWPDAPHPMRWVHGQAANPFQVQAAEQTRSEIAGIVTPLVTDFLAGFTG